MELARHASIDLTMNDYTHLELRDLGKAVCKLPSLPRQEKDNAQAREKHA